MIHMTTLRCSIVAIVSCVLLAAQSSTATTVPSGTTLIVKSVDTISSRDRARRTYPAEVAHDVVVGGKVAIKAGAQATIRVESGALTLTLAYVSVNGKSVAIQTTSIEPRNKSGTVRRRAANISTGSIVLGPGTQMEFLLTQPLHL
jgi:hypothetical protein